MWQRFTNNARRTIFLAQQEAQKLGHGAVGPEQLILGLCEQPDTKSAKLLRALGIEREMLKERLLEKLSNTAYAPSPDMTLTPEAKMLVQLAYSEARNLNNNHLGTEHLLLGAIALNQGASGETLRELGLTLHMAREALIQMQETTPRQWQPLARPRFQTAPPPLTVTMKQVLSSFDSLCARTGRLPEILFLMCLDDSKGRAATAVGSLFPLEAARRAVEGVLINTPAENESEVSFEQILSYAATTARECGVAAPHSGHLAFAAIKASERLAAALKELVDLEVLQTALLLES